jgi:hypothetical protein
MSTRALAELILRLERRHNAAISDAEAAEAVEWLERDIDSRLGRPYVPDANQSVAVSLLNPKTAALCFDRVWWMPIRNDQPPPDILAYGASELEIWMQVLIAGHRNGKFTDEDLPELLQDTPLHLKPTQKELPIERLIAEAIYESRQFVATPVLSTEEMRDKQYAAGKTEAIVAAINALHIVNEEKLTWAQVEEVRRDVEATRKYRRLVHWLDMDMVGRSTTFIADEIASRIADYEWVIRKHGLQTALGTLSCLLDPRFLAAAGTVTTGAALFGGTSWAAASAALMAVAQSGITVVSRFIDLEDTKRTAATDIAYVFELRKLPRVEAPAPNSSQKLTRPDAIGVGRAG